MGLKWEIEFYTKRSGRCQVQDFLDKVEIRDMPYIENQLERLETYGIDLGRPHVGYLRDHIRELRVDAPRVTYRLLFFVQIEKRTIILTNGYKKKARHVPDSVIDKAIEYMNDYLNRQKEGKRK